MKTAEAGRMEARTNDIIKNAIESFKIENELDQRLIREMFYLVYERGVLDGIIGIVEK